MSRWNRSAWKISAGLAVSAYFHFEAVFFVPAVIVGLGFSGPWFKRLLGIGFHETSADGSVTLEPVYCLGLCACAPSAMLDGAVIGRLDDETIDEIVAEVRA